jgi:hypothetical protein
LIHQGEKEEENVDELEDRKERFKLVYCLIWRGGYNTILRHGKAGYELPEVILRKKSR